MSRSKYPSGFWSLWVAVAVNMTGFGIIIPILPLYAERFGASPTVIGFLFAAYSLAQFAMSPVWGSISDRAGRRPIMLVTIAGSAIGSLVTGLAGSIVMLFVGRIADGGSGASIAVARAAIADMADEADRPRLMGLLGAGFGLGFILGPVLGSVASAWGAAAPFFLAAGISVLNFVTTFVRMEEPEKRTESASARFGRNGMTPHTRRLIWGTFATIAGFSAFEATFALLANRRVGLTEGGVAVVFAYIGLVLVLVQGGLIGVLTRKLDERRVLLIGLGVMAIGFVGLAAAESWWAFGVTLTALAAAQGLVAPTLSSSIATTSAPEAFGKVLGYQQSASGLGRVVGPAVGGALFAAHISAPYLVAAGAVCIALVAVAGVRTSQVADQVR